VIIGEVGCSFWTISPASKIEGEAIRQLKRAGSLPGMLGGFGGHNTIMALT